MKYWSGEVNEDHGWGGITSAMVGLAFTGAMQTQGSVLVDFNTAGDLAANFVQNSGTSLMTDGQNQGIGDPASLAVRPSDSDRTAVYTPQKFTLGIGDKVTISMFIRMQATTVSTGQRALQLGLGTATSSLFTSSADSFISARLDGVAGLPSPTYELELQHRDGSSLTTTPQTTTFTLAAGTYYQLTVDIERTAASTYSVAGSLTNFGSNGLIAGATVASFAPVSITNNALGSMTVPDLNAGFRAQFTAGALRVDNFSVVVPEPSAMALTGLGALALLARRR